MMNISKIEKLIRNYIAVRLLQNLVMILMSKTQLKKWAFKAI